MTDIEQARIDTIEEQIEDLTDQYNKRSAVAERLNQQLTTYQNKKDKSIKNLELEEAALSVLLQLEEIWRKDFEKNIEQIISEGIKLVFGEHLNFVITTKIERNSSAVYFTIETGDTETSISAEGGSLIQIVSFLLRIIPIKVFKPALRFIIILDEAFTGLDEENVPATALLLRKTADDGIQIIFVTHNRTYIEYADIVYEVSKGTVKLLKENNYGN